MTLEFEWDDAKAAINEQRHSVSFVYATGAFLDPFAVEWIDDRADYGEERINLLGLTDGHILHVTYTERDSRIRMISARRATRHEQQDYYSNNAF